MSLHRDEYLEYRLVPDEPAALEALLGLCSALPFESFMEAEGSLMAWLPAHADQAELEARLDALRGILPFRWRRRRLKARNWNAVWEARFQPVVVRDFCGVRAPFHAPLEGVRYELVIEPKMAFGTGHHETTWMMLDRMEQLDFQGKRVLDYGCGTGVLAILAARLGAARVVAVDIERPAWENTIENAARNGAADRLVAIHGSLEDVPPGAYDLVLANIERSTILHSLSALHRRLSANGVLLLSGILDADEPLMLDAAHQHGFRPVFRNQRNKWLCLEWRRL